ncbi:MAG: Tex-like N-terminal domain-containing protein, partial [Peptoniphilaceae bacterium]
MTIGRILAGEFHIAPEQMDATLKLLDEGNTVPFIARYRKEVTGGIEDETLRKIEGRKKELEKVEDRRQTVLNTIESQGKLTEELKAAIDVTWDMQTLEDLYRPYKPKRRTRATDALEKGLGPLAENFLSDASLKDFEDGVDAFED